MQFLVASSRQAGHQTRPSRTTPCPCKLSTGLSARKVVCSREELPTASFRRSTNAWTHSPVPQNIGFLPFTRVMLVPLASECLRSHHVTRCVDRAWMHTLCEMAIRHNSDPSASISTVPCPSGAIGKYSVVVMERHIHCCIPIGVALERGASLLRRFNFVLR